VKRLLLDKDSDSYRNPIDKLEMQVNPESLQFSIKAKDSNP
ncbi:MAG: hypothetical protein QOH78_990, partial [Verrucomicrobiota bacterium]